jgi:hypothetical protein
VEPEPVAVPDIIATQVPSQGGGVLLQASAGMQEITNKIIIHVFFMHISSTTVYPSRVV